MTYVDNSAIRGIETELSRIASALEKLIKLKEKEKESKRINRK